MGEAYPIANLISLVNGFTSFTIHAFTSFTARLRVDECNY